MSGNNQEESKKQCKKKAADGDKTGAELLQISRIVYGTKSLKECMEAVIRLHARG